MKIKNIRFRNFAAYGNEWQELSFDEVGNFFLVTGENGAGKCVHPDTLIDVSASEDIIEMFNKYLDK